MPCLTTWAPFLLRSGVGVAHVDNVITKRCSKQSHGCSCQGCQATNHTGTLQNLPEPTPAHTGTLRNLPELASHTGTLRNLPELASGTYTSAHRNPPEPSFGTCSCDLHWHTPALIWAEDPISVRCWGKNDF